MSQNQQILSHLESGKSITPLFALNKFGVFRLGARIWDLRRAGHPIIRHMAYDRKSRKHFAMYSLAKKRRRAA